MKIMVGFYQKGRDRKMAQRDRAKQELDSLEVDEQMIKDQLEALNPFPDYHPKKQYYLEELNNELEELLRHKQKFVTQFENFDKLYIWGIGIVETMEWLDETLQAYANAVLETDFEGADIEITVEQYKKYRQGVSEITFNLQESQDFFDASLDGRLEKYHQLEKCMIEAQVEVLQKYQTDRMRTKHVCGELLKDLEFIIDTMEVNPKVTRHRTRMRQMHKDFFAVLKWQREKLISILENEPEKIIGDIEELRAYMSTTDPDEIDDDIKETSDRVEAIRQMTPSQTIQEYTDEELEGTPVEEGKCPIDHTKFEGAECPVTNNKKDDFTIQNLYEDK
eukprot:TRINITY_DN3550_c0_g1_i1.p1 TRINITY_DN3550_c0_g1~~TRINITY_DN3550_c0_g1_i1.p1  ORF type:complete len:374 (+),score=106.79 TRINITY_DN3550_c0_g1_i1:119-1123(+)